MKKMVQDTSALVEINPEQKLDLEALTEILADNDRFEPFVAAIPSVLASSSDHIEYPHPPELLR